MSDPTEGMTEAEMADYYNRTRDLSGFDLEHPVPVTFLRPCRECGESVARDDVRAGYGMCGSCLHDALRSGWTPGEG